MVSRILVICLLFILSLPLEAGKVYVTSYRGLDEVKIFQVSSTGEADLVVYISKIRGEVKGRDALWYYTKIRADADRTIFFTKFRGEADIRVFFTNNRGEAGWRNDSKFMGFLKGSKYE